MGQPQRTPQIEKKKHLHVAFSTEKKGRRGGPRILWGLLILAVIIGLAVLFLYHPVKLTWNASTTTNPYLVYNVYRAEGPCGSGAVPKLIGTTSELTYWDSSIKLGTFCYTVRASVPAESVDSNPSHVTIRPTWRH
jgi:hypothetical protein